MRSSEILRLVPFLFLAAFGISTQAQQFDNLPELSGLSTYEVVRVIDGDTFEARTGSEIFKIRLIGVDAPETVHPSKPVEQYGIEASQFTANLLLGERVYVITDSQQGETDKYGRTLAFVFRYPDGLFVNAEIIRQGYGHVYTIYPFRYMEQFRALEKQARKAGKGLWAANAAPSNCVTNSSMTTSVQRSSQPNTSATVYITRTGKKYHSGGCRYLSKSKIPISLKDAKARGYTPCKVCKPSR